jgi:hypothetical protein
MKARRMDDPLANKGFWPSRRAKPDHKKRARTAWSRDVYDMPAGQGMTDEKRSGFTRIEFSEFSSAVSSQFLTK